MPSIDHLHTDVKMLKGREHLEIRSAQWLARCLDADNVYHSNTTRISPKRHMKETLVTRHRSTVEPVMIANDKKIKLKEIHTDAVIKAQQTGKKCSVG